MPRVAIKDIVVDHSIQIRRGNREETIRRYEEAFEKLPPVDLFKTSEGLLLADGFHRVAAGQRLGLRDVSANIHRGTREDALEFAVVANAKNADPLSPDERDEGIRRLKNLHPDWTNASIAKAVSVSEVTVRRVFQTDVVEKALLTAPRGGEIAKRRSVLAELAAAPRKVWEPLAEAAIERGWTRDEVRLAVQNLKSERIPKSHKTELLAGKADPLAVDAAGEFAIPAAAVGRKVKELKQRDALLTLYRALEAAGRLRHFDMAKLADAVAEDGRLARVTDEVDEQVELWKELLAALRKVKSRRLEVIS